MTADEAMQLVRAQVPWWVPWFPVLSALSMFVAGWLLGRIAVAMGLARFRRTPTDAPWTERARAATTARVLASQSLLYAIIVGVIGARSGLLGVISRGEAMAVGAVAAVVGAAVARGHLEDALGLKRTRRGSGIGLLLALYATLPTTVLVGAIAMQLDTVSAILLWVLGGLLLAGWLRALSVPALRAFGAASAAPERVHAIVARACEKVGMRPPETIVLHMRMANAYAFPFAGALAFTDPILETLDDAGLEAITLHELGHLQEPPRIVAFRAMRVGLNYALALCGVLWRFGPVPSLVLSLVVLVLALWSRRQLARLEVAADAVAHDHGEEGALALALARVYERNLSPMVSARVGTHPHLYDRLIAAGAAPAYPRPAPPEAARVLRFALFAVTALFVFGIYAAIAWRDPLELLATTRHCDALSQASPPLPSAIASYVATACDP